MKPEKKIFSLRWLMFAVLVTASISSVTLSRYMTTVSGTATASIARFQVSMATEPLAHNFNGSVHEGDAQSLDYPFTVTSDSDVAVDYQVNITFAKPLPDYIVPTVRQENGQAVAGVTEDRISFTFPGFQFHQPGTATTNVHYLTVTTQYLQGKQQGLVNDFTNFADKVSVTISVTAEQKMS